MGVTTVTASGEPVPVSSAASITAGAPGAGGLGPGRVRCVVAALMLTLLLAALGQTIVATALPEIVGDLRGLDRMSWAVTAYLLATTVAMPLHGKLGDLLGRKSVFQVALAVFVLGSALAGWARTMDQLIACRALQGVGAGGVLIGVQAIVADIVPPRQRGRWMGLIGAAFGLASLAGPLLGGLITDHASWRWCFHANVPLGLLAMGVVAFVLKLPRPHGRPRLDPLGALLLAAASTFVVLLTSWGGSEYAWTSRTVLGLAAGAAGTILLFLVVESLVPEPVMPLRLFRDSVFTVTGLVGAATGVALFTAAGFLPTFLQMVYGASATRSGLLILPLMGGVVVASILSGRLITRTGRYKALPVVGCALAAAGLWLLSRLSTGTPRVSYSLWMAVLGVGIGLVLPVLIVAVQNSVPPSDLGVATSAHNYFRQIGGAVGAAVFGTLFSHRLAERLASDLPEGADRPEPESITPHLVYAMDTALREGYVRAYAEAMPRVFLYLAPVLVLGSLLAFLLKEKPLVSYNASLAEPPAPGVPTARTAEPPPAPAPGPVGAAPPV
ncbi:MDR family MFS transporter, partial [Streptomyces sp. URMC 123]|uniref:MDR family MFS transporter n=1 Tax=Streptomyces sp. URMC 123 TaxID=3423403 RepID=UPI003F1B8FDE